MEISSQSSGFQRQPIDFMLSENRDALATKRFFKKALTSSHNQSPRVITIDKNPAYPIAVQQLKDEKVMNHETLKKEQIECNHSSVLSEVELINILFGLTA
jgi:transposase-like protein